jgi:hypothetical protein
MIDHSTPLIDQAAAAAFCFFFLFISITFIPEDNDRSDD